MERIESGAYDVIILNFANCDMVGHTGVFDAAVRAVETVDDVRGQVVDATMKMGGIAMITADHGNAEVMTQPDGSPMTAHTTDPVPFILCGAGSELRQAVWQTLRRPFWMSWALLCRRRWTARP